MLAFLLSRFFGDLVWEKQLLKNSEELMGRQCGHFNVRETTNFIPGVKIDERFRVESRSWSSSIDLLPLMFAFSNRKDACTNYFCMQI